MKSKSSIFLFSTESSFKEACLETKKNMSVLSLKCHIGYYWDSFSDGGKQNLILIFLISKPKDGSLSDTAVSSIDNLRHARHEGGRGGRSAGNSAGPAGAAGMGKKSNSTSQLSAAGNEALKSLLHLLKNRSFIGHKAQFFFSFIKAI